MSKQSEVRAHYEQRGLASSGDAFNRDMFRAKQKDDNSHRSEPAPRNAEVDAWFDDCHAKCAGCCGEDEDNPENNSSCCVIL